MMTRPDLGSQSVTAFIQIQTKRYMLLNIQNDTQNSKRAIDGYFYHTGWIFAPHRWMMNFTKGVRFTCALISLPNFSASCKYVFFRILLNVKLFPILLRVHQSHWEGDSISGIGKLFIKKGQLPIRFYQLLFSENAFLYKYISRLKVSKNHLNKRAAKQFHDFVQMCVLWTKYIITEMEVAPCYALFMLFTV